MDDYRSTYRALTAAYDDASRQHDRKMDFLGAWVYRPLSFGLTVPFLRSGWVANQVTWLRIVVMVMAFALLIYGQHWSVIAGATLCLVNVFLDLVDGNLARLQGPSDFGGFLDEIADILVKIFTPVAVAAGLFVRPDRLLATLDIGGETVLLVGIVTGLVSATRAFLKAEFAYRKQSFDTRHAAAPEPAPAVADPAATVLSVPYIYRTGVSLMLLLLPLFAVLDLLSVYLCLIFLSRALVFPLELVGLVLTARNSLVN
ncbi:MAG: CDP-alcohol phosphatidyltransferase family protein [Gammaproteobacteria bacterium]|nr:CDP-alcohol phosphatidyltransferase family protein [Gammaproteobacteria bacterium]